MKNGLVLAVLMCLVFACGEESFTPKPRSYPRVFFPEKAYQTFDTSFCQFTFRYPVYTQIEQDRTFFDETVASDCWFDVYYPSFDGRVHFTYYPITGEHTMESLRQDAFELADWHNKRANYIDELVIKNDRTGVSGIAFDIDGPAASPFQFFLTDSTRHFVRGALYFNTQARPDSLAPVIDFVKEDILVLIESFEWEE